MAKRTPPASLIAKLDAAAAELSALRIKLAGRGLTGDLTNHIDAATESLAAAGATVDDDGTLDDTRSG